MPVLRQSQVTCGSCDMQMDQEGGWWCVAAREVATVIVSQQCLQFPSYPFDLARTRLAVDVGRHVSERIYRGPVDCIVKVYRNVSEY